MEPSSDPPAPDSLPRDPMLDRQIQFGRGTQYEIPQRHAVEFVVGEKIGPVPLRRTGQPLVFPLPFQHTVNVSNSLRCLSVSEMPGAAESDPTGKRLQAPVHVRAVVNAVDPPFGDQTPVPIMRLQIVVRVLPGDVLLGIADRPSFDQGDAEDVDKPAVVSEVDDHRRPKAVRDTLAVNRVAATNGARVGDPVGVGD